VIQPAEKFQNFGLRNDIERAGGFIGDHEGWLVQDSHGDQQSLRLPYTQLARIAAKKPFLSR